MYSLIIDGSKLKTANDLLTTISSDTSNKEDILKLSNYADGLFVSMKQTNALPSGTKIKLYVGDKYADGSLVNIYGFDKNNQALKIINNSLSVKDGYVEFEAENYSEYFITMSTMNSTNSSVNNTSTTNIFMIVSIIELLLIVLILVLDYMKLNPICKLKK